MKKIWLPQADLIIKNVKIYTVDLTVEDIRRGKTDFTVIENGYVASKEGKTMAIGNGFDESLVGLSARVIDGEGNVLIPGLIDSHIHALFAVMELMNVNFRETKSKEEFIKMLKSKIAVTEKGQWIKGSEWNELGWDTKESPAKADLDRVSTEHPIICYRLCHHVSVVNSKALYLANIAKDTLNPDGGIIGRDDEGNPNGLMYENSAIALIESVISEATEEQLILAVEKTGKVMNLVGVTSCIDSLEHS